MIATQELFNKGRFLLNGLPQPALEAKILLLKCLTISEEEFLSNPERKISRKEERDFYKLVSRRLAGFPLAYLTGKKEFWSIPFRVSPGVLIPRPETELVVERVLELAAQNQPVGLTRQPPTNKVAALHIPGTQDLTNKALASKVLAGQIIIVDVGTGCGNIAISLAKELPRARIYATDNSKKALAVARLNSLLLQTDNITFVGGSLFSPLRRLKLWKECDFIVSNPPYVSEKGWTRLPEEIRNYEPARALVAGKTGIEVIRDLIKGSPRYLKTGGYLVLEIGEGQKKEVLSLFNSSWSEVRFFNDLNKIPRVAVARKT